MSRNTKPRAPNEGAAIVVATSHANQLPPPTLTNDATKYTQQSSLLLKKQKNCKSTIPSRNSETVTYPSPQLSHNHEHTYTPKYVTPAHTTTPTPHYLLQHGGATAT